ncbi:hypothetical protein J2Z48_002089 [Croceifilum oryzae]|uniref:Uncharacterized protein n=1 Tax=Croceifilum oryzae TaxID=1553429 RepID=A0AAJ1TFC3_9BACL|nr:hypothetical protein [Croceifilum oryzae]MDQ0417905.1 hypothetical protein [Croceifilum oryzae]
MKVTSELPSIPQEYISTELSHLTDVQIYELIDRYYAKEDLEVLIDEYKLKGVRPTNLVSKFPPTIEDSSCPFCNTHYITYRKPRTGIKKPTHCPNCNHLENNRRSYCTCSNCINGRKSKLEQTYKERKAYEEEKHRIEEEQRKKMEEEQRQKEQEHRELIEKSYDVSRVPKRKLSDLNFKDLWLLNSLLSVGYDEEKLLIKPVWSYQDDLAPSKDFIMDMIKHLFHSGIILPYPKENINSFSKEQFRALEVYFYINIEEFHNDTTKALEYLINPPLRDVITLILNDLDLVEQCWKKLVFEEVFQDLRFRLGKLDQSLDRNEKVNTTLSGLINHFSSGQLFHMSHKQIANKNLWYASNLGHIPDRFVDVILDGLKQYGDLALSKEWDLYGFTTRHAELPATAVSDVFFNKLLFLGEECLTICPSINFLFSHTDKLVDQVLFEHQKKEKENEMKAKMNLLDHPNTENDSESAEANPNQESKEEPSDPLEIKDTETKSTLSAKLKKKKYKKKKKKKKRK